MNPFQLRIAHIHLRTPKLFPIRADGLVLTTDRDKGEKMRKGELQ